MRVVLISGKMGSGKSTLAQGLVSALSARGFEVKVFKFANPLYELHDACLEVLRDYGIQRPVKDGELLQILGTEYGRNCIDKDVWVKCTRHAIGSWVAMNGDAAERGIAIINDARFRNEFDGFDEAFSIRLEASKEVRKQRVSYWRENDQHASEVDLDGYAAEGRFSLLLDVAALDQEATLAAAVMGICNHFGLE